MTHITTLAPAGTSYNDLYVAITRATQRLGVVHEGDLPEALARLCPRADVDPG